MLLWKEGGNYRIELGDGFATCTVWRRPDLDAAAGARLAGEKIAHFKTLAPLVRSLIFDLRQAPTAVGPKTQAALVAMLTPFHDLRRSVAVVTSLDPVQRMQLRQLFKQSGLDRIHLVTSLDEGLALLRR